MTIEEELRAIRQELEVLRNRLGLPEPRAFRYQRAAELLDISLATLKRRIRAGDIVPSLIGDTKVISAAEIERVLSRRETPSSVTETPEAKTTRTRSPVAPGTSSRSKSSAKAESAKVRAALKGRR